MAKVKDILKSKPKRKIHLAAIEQVASDNIWASHDDIMDSLVIYITGQPERSFVTHLTDDIAAMVHIKSHTLVGFMVDSWGEKYAQDFAALRQEWLIAAQELANRMHDSSISVGDIDTRLYPTFLHLQDNKDAQLTPTSSI